MLTTFAYIKRDSFVHRLDPRTKIVLLFAISFSISQTSNVLFVVISFLLTLLYYSYTSLRWSETKNTWRLIFFVSTILTLGNYFLSGGHVIQGVDQTPQQHMLATIPFFGIISRPPYVGPTPLIVSVETLVFVVTQMMRNISIAACAIIIPYTIDPGHMGVAFRGLGFPDKLAYALDLSFRFLPTVIRDLDTTMAAQKARGFELDKLRGGLIAKVARITPLLLPVVIGSVLGAEDIINAMELRCFGTNKRTWFVELTMNQASRILTVLGILGFLLTTLWNIAGYFYADGWLHLLHVQAIPALLAP